MAGQESVPVSAMKRSWSRAEGLLIVEYVEPGADAVARVEQLVLEGEALPEDQQLAGEVVVVPTEDRSSCFLFISAEWWTDLEPWLRFVHSSVVDSSRSGVLRLGQTYRRPRWLTDGPERIAYAALLRLDYELPHGPIGLAQRTELASERLLEFSGRLLSASPRVSIDFGGPAVQLAGAAGDVAWSKLVSSGGYGVLHLDDSGSRVQRTIAVNGMTP